MQHGESYDAPVMVLRGGLPETPPDTKTPIMRPIPQPQLMERKSPFFESLSFD